MNKNIFCFIALIAGFIQAALAQQVSIIKQDDSLQAKYATSRLEKALIKQGYSLKSESGEYGITLVLNTKVLKPEAYTIAVKGKNITVTGGNGTGILYGSLALAEDLRNGVRLQNIQARSESPKLPFRAIKFDLPWDTYRHSYSLDQHIETCRDVKYWEAFLDMMAENRFNALTLWNLHPYTFMIRAKNFPARVPSARCLAH